MRNSTRKAALVALICALPACPLVAQQQVVSDVARVGERAQTDIRTETQKVEADLSRIISEFEHNGLGEDADVRVLRAIKQILSSLSREEMGKVIALLQEARNAQGTAKLADAVSQQKTIVVKLQQVLIEYQRQQELADVSLRFNKLAEQQNGNMKAARSLARLTRGKPLNEQQQAMLKVQRAEQANIRDQVAAQIKRLETLSTQVEEGTAQKVSTLLESARSNRLLDQLGGATTDLESNRIFTAVAKEKSGRDQLRQLAGIVAPKREPDTVLQDCIQILTEQIGEQKQIVDTVRGADANQQSEDLQDREADVVDAIDMLRKDVQPLVPQACDELDKSIQNMQEARTALTSRDLKPAAKPGTAAVLNMETALKQLQTQLAFLEQQQLDKNIQDQLKKLKEQLVALREAEQKLQGDTRGIKESSRLMVLAPKQADLLKTARDLVLLVAGEAPAAVQPMNDAARDMDSAGKMLAATSDGDEVVRPEQSAIDNLIKAEALLDQKLAELDKAKDQLDKLQQAREDLAKAMAAEQKVQTDAAKLAATQDKNKPQDNAKAQSDLAKQQGDVAKKAEDIKKAIDDAKGDQNAAQDQQANAQGQQDASKAMGDAVNDANKAQSDLNNQNAPAASQDAQKAMADMGKAAAALDQQIAGLQQQLGQQPDNAAALAQAAAGIQQAQQQVASGQEAMQQQGQQPQAGQQQGQQQQGGQQDGQQQAGQQQGGEQQGQQQAGQQQGEQKASQELAKGAATATETGAQGGLPQAAQQALQQAAAAASAASAAAAAGNTPAAQAQAQAAQAALSQAAAAVSAAQSGMSQQQAGGPPTPGGPPGPPGTPGTPSPTPGQANENNPQKGMGERKDDNVNSDGHAGGVAVRGGSQFIGLPARERGAILQDRNEKYPEEYGPMIETYLRNLSENGR
jgi:hypothetical protein